MAFKAIGIDLGWRGRGNAEIGYCDRTGNALVRINRGFSVPPRSTSFVAISAKHFRCSAGDLKRTWTLFAR